jgi:hypothetical protein
VEGRTSDAWRALVDWKCLALFLGFNLSGTCSKGDRTMLELTNDSFPGQRWVEPSQERLSSEEAMSDFCPFRRA